MYRGRAGGLHPTGMLSYYSIPILVLPSIQSGLFKFFDMVYFIIRILWLFVVVTGVTLFAYQVTDRIIVYYQRNTNVDVEVKYVSSVEFPSVTICNQNQFR